MIAKLCWQFQELEGEGLPGGCPVTCVTANPRPTAPYATQHANPHTLPRVRQAVKREGSARFCSELLRMSGCFHGMVIGSQKAWWLRALLTTRWALTAASESSRGPQAEPEVQRDGSPLGVSAERNPLGQLWRISLPQRQNAQEAGPSPETGLL